MPTISVDESFSGSSVFAGKLRAKIFSLSHFYYMIQMHVISLSFDKKFNGIESATWIVHFPSLLNKYKELISLFDLHQVT